MTLSASVPRPGESGVPGGSGASESEARGRAGDAAVAIAVMGTIAAVFVWWAWKQGAFFGNVFFPGAMLVYALLIVLLLAGPPLARPKGPAAIALAAILGLAAWTLLSITWSPVDDGAVQDFERAMLYAGVFALGVWTYNLRRRWMLVPLWVLAATGAVIGIVITMTLAGGTDVPSFVHSDATLRFPIGYRNGEAAFLLICFWPTIVLAAEGELPWQVRVSLVGVGTMLLELAVLSESRGSMPAAAASLAVFIALSPRRLRAAAYLALAAVPVLVALPTLIDVYQHGHGGPGLIPFLRDAARLIAITSLGSVALAALCIRGIEFRLDLGERRVKLLSRVVAGIAVVVVVAGGAAFVAKRGGPIDFVDQRVSEFKKVGYPDLRKQGIRFGANVGSNRHDFWRVALDEGGDHPLRGGGAGSFSHTYLIERKSGESPQDPHSAEMLIFSELGGIGLLLLIAFLVSVVIAGLRTRRLGQPGAALVTGGLAAGTYWMVHSSYDWFWLYPELTASAMFLFGAVAGPTMLKSGAQLGRRARFAGVAVFAAAFLIAVPLFFSQRYMDRALDDYPSDPSAALQNLDRAADWNPYDPRPLTTAGVVETRLGLNGAAAATLREAIDRHPDGYAPHFFLARVLESRNIGAAQREAADALRLNPLDPDTQELNQHLRDRAKEISKNR